MNTLSSHLPSYFSLPPHLYAAAFENAVIILDVKNNKYLSLIDDAATALHSILGKKFILRQDGNYIPEEISNNDEEEQEWIAYFLENNFIQVGLKPTTLPTPLKEGGLYGYRWDTKSFWKPFSESSWLDTIYSFWMLRKVSRSMNHKGLQEIFDLIQQTSSSGNLYEPSSQEIKKLSAAVDAASLLYSKKTLCLAWAATFALMAKRKNWKINFVIGVQTNPFYAHAWVENVSGDVINDDPSVSKALSVLFRGPHL